MNLEIFNKLEKVFKDNKTEEFINELDNKVKQNDFISIMELKNLYKLTTESLKKISRIYEQNIEDFSKEQGSEIYYTTYKNEDNNKFLVTCYNDGKRENTYIFADELPKEIKLNMILKKNNNEFLIDFDKSKYIMDKTLEKLNDIQTEQNKELADFRVDCDVYQVVENNGYSIYLLNTNTKEIFEEVNFSEEIIKKAIPDVFLRYENGEYVIDYKLTDEFFNKLENNN